MHGWDQVVQGLVQLAFTLMDAFGPRAAFGKVTEPTAAKRTPGQKACQLGADVLLETFKVCYNSLTYPDTQLLLFSSLARYMRWCVQKYCNSF